MGDRANSPTETIGVNMNNQIQSCFTCAVIPKRDHFLKFPRRVDVE